MTLTALVRQLRQATLTSPLPAAATVAAGWGGPGGQGPGGQRYGRCR